MAVGTLSADDDRKEFILSSVKKWAPYFQKEGFEVGVWFWSFMFDGEADFTRITGLEGDFIKNRGCPLDENYINFVSGYVEEFAKIGLDFILFDDDYRFCHLKVKHRTGCFCAHHMKEIEKRLCEPVTRELLLEKILEDKPNKYREAWYSANGDSLISFAKKMRDVADKINPSVRLGQCSCYTSWDADGTTAVKIAKAFAGNTRPFFRMTSAPYWQPEGLCDATLIDVIDFARIQLEWCRGENVEVMAEGDTWPRGRYYVPKSYLELFDTALIADGKMENILKYVFDYVSPYDYEDGYFSEHIESMKLYSEIEEIFKDKDDTGVYVCDIPEKTKYATLPYKNDNFDYIHSLSFPKAARLLSQYSVPVTYTNKDGVKAIFAEVGETFERRELRGEAILDAHAAECLSNRGIDVGFADETSVNDIADMLYYPKRNAVSSVRGALPIIKRKLKSTARVLLYATFDEEKQPLIYTYENKEGEKFLVTLIDTRKIARDAGKDPYIQDALFDGIAEISEKPLSAVCKRNPELYVITKEKDEKIAVGLWNISHDKLFNKEIVLPGEIESVKFIGGEGNFTGNKVNIKSLPAFSMMAFEATIKK